MADDKFKHRAAFVEADRDSKGSLSLEDAAAAAQKAVSAPGTPDIPSVRVTDGCVFIAAAHGHCRGHCGAADPLCALYGGGFIHCRRVGRSPPQAVTKQVDTGAKGSLNIDEFCSLLSRLSLVDQWRAAFQVRDLGGMGVAPEGGRGRVNGVTATFVRAALCWEPQRGCAVRFSTPRWCVCMCPPAGPAAD